MGAAAAAAAAALVDEGEYEDDEKCRSARDAAGRLVAAVLVAIVPIPDNVSGVFRWLFFYSNVKAPCFLTRVGQF